MSEGKVTHIIPAEKPPLELIEKPGSCSHKFCGTWLDADSRRVTCKGCGEELDPFSVLQWMAEGFKAQNWKLKAIQEYEEREAQKKKDAKGKAWAKQNHWRYDNRRGIWEKVSVGFVVKNRTPPRPWSGGRYLGGGGKTFHDESFETMREAMEAIEAL